jgi:hypothetical protein
MNQGKAEGKITPLPLFLGTCVFVGVSSGNITFLALECRLSSATLRGLPGLHP